MDLAGMPGVWSRLMRVLFGKFPFSAVYLDHICVFSHNMQENLEHLESSFHVFREAKLYAHVISDKIKSNLWVIQHCKKGLSTDYSKTDAIQNWPAPTNQKELQSFLGLAGYYRRIICTFAHLSIPLGPLVKKNTIRNVFKRNQAQFKQ